MSTNNSSNSTKEEEFYSSAIDMVYIERAILAEDIILPTLPPFPPHKDCKAGTAYYPYAIQLYKNVLAKFNIPIITPFDAYGTASTNTVNATSTKNIINDNNLQVSSYENTNYVELVVPKNILMNFEDIVPAGTVFFVCFIGGALEVDNMKIIGVDVDAGE